MIRAVIQTGLTVVIMGIILFAAAGNWGWIAAWVYLVEMAGAGMAISLWLYRHDPALLEARMSMPVHRDQAGWDRLFMIGICVVFVLWLALMGLDARFGWSRVPVWAQGLGAVLIVLGLGLVVPVFRVNSFATPQVRLQPGRGQYVITTGPYRIMRHPMYAVMSLYLAGMPLLLGSWWGLAAMALMMLGIGWRAIGEERLLARELDGYAAYMQRVRYRLIPGIW